MRRAHDEPCRFYRNDDRADTARFYEALPDAPTLGKWNIVYCSEWDDKRFPFQFEPGCIRRPPFGFTGRVSPEGLTFAHVCGTDEDFRDGGLYLPDEPPIKVGAQNLPLCCDPPKRVVGGSASGGVADFTVYKMRVYGGSASGGVSAYAVTTAGDPWAGGLALGGEWGEQYTALDPWVGGLELGTGWGDVFNGPGQWIQGEAGHWTFTATRTGAHLIECWAPGGGGGETGTITPDDGGGGGSYASAVLSLVAGTDYDVFVGAGGMPGFGAVPATDPTYFGDGTLVNAGGGDPGAVGGGPGVPVHGTVGFEGGRGAERGGGGSAGRFSPGNDASGDSGGAPVTDGGAGGDAEAPGASPGGGGGGGDTGMGGFGGTGLVIITWPPPP